MKHWAFDLDGTLVDSFSHYFVLMEEIFKQHGRQFTKDLHHPALTQSLQDLFTEHLGADAVPGAFKLLRAGSAKDARHIRPFIGVTETIEQLIEGGSRIAVWTNRDLASASLIIEHSGLGKYVELCVSGTCVAQRKPHPEGLERIAREFGCAPDQITMVGDHEYDVIGANTLGARSVRASWHSYWNVDPCSYAQHQFHSVDEFSRWIAQK